MNLHQKLIEIRKGVPYLKKASKNQQQGFLYTSSSQVLSALKAGMDELGVLLVPEITGHVLHEKSTMTLKKLDGKEESGKQHVTELDLLMTWVDAEKPSDTISCTWYAQGVDQHEKGVGKALTYAEKFFMLKFFNIPTDKDDPDAFEERMKGGGDNGDEPPDDKKVDRKPMGVCPDCGKSTIIKGKPEFGGGWVCWKTKGGCGHTFKTDPAEAPSATKGAAAKPLNATQIAKIVYLCQKLKEPLGSQDAQAMIDGYCAAHGGQTYANGKYIEENVEALAAEYNKTDDEIPF